MKIINMSKLKIDNILVFKQFLKFAIVGMGNTILGIVIQWIFLALGFHYFVGSIVGFLVTVVIAYILNNIFSFKEEDGEVRWELKAFFKVFLSYSFTGLFLANIGLYIMNEICGISPNISPILNLIVTVPVNFILNKVWAYR